jgi:hypothetical protein
VVDTLDLFVSSDENHDGRDCCVVTSAVRLNRQKTNKRLVDIMLEYAKISFHTSSFKVK